MSRRNKELPLLSGVEITDAGSEGMAVARHEGMVIFVPFVVPGDIADIQLYKKKKNYAEGRAVRILKESLLRVPPSCPHFGVCGGCKWQTMSYEAQLEAKQRQVRDNLMRLGNIDCSEMRPICGSDNIFHYRNKLEFTFSTRAWRTTDQMAANETVPIRGALGFHIPQLFDKVLSIEHCVLQAEPSNAIRLAVRDYAETHQLPFYDIRNHTGFLRNLVIRNTSTGHWMVILIVAEDSTERLFPLLDMLHDRFPEITSLQYIINTKMNDSYSDLDVHTYLGSEHIEECMAPWHPEKQKDLHFIINPKSFYQTNSAQAQRLYSFVAELAELQPEDNLYDLYTGTGTIALFLASQAKQVVGIEYVEEAIADARINARLNGFDNTAFYAGDMAKVLTSEFIDANGRPDVVVTDPPRAGMHESVVRQLLETAPRKIVYVSCNPATQARDLHMLSERYEVRRIQPVDMFPHTQHVENIAELVLVR
ncbi:MAG: 23S rRNA (uracil(1939)-C(5))-methyltransferase RlmD [Bacteroidales bacterium]|nr:23S rRNA (uracil(1939)-C(5))-methyltransferase RlmD [Bacteroidales bacterium]